MKGMYSDAGQQLGATAQFVTHSPGWTTNTMTVILDPYNRSLFHLQCSISYMSYPTWEYRKIKQSY